jgi:adenylate cyclase class IV
MRNLEFKAWIEDPQAVFVKARALGAELWGDLRQTDTYFDVPRGRLKLRETPSFPAELVFYERDEDAAARPSDYQVARTSDGASLLALLSAAFGLRGVVGKQRRLLFLDTTRIHLDNVDGLGSFVEIEVPVRDSEDEAAAGQRLASLISGLGLDAAAGLRASYIDLIIEKESKA